MQRAIVLFVAAALLVGCAPAEPIDEVLTIYQPGEKYALTYRTGFDSGQGEVLEWGERMLLTVSDAEPGGAEVVMTFAGQGEGLAASLATEVEPALLRMPESPQYDPEEEAGYYREWIAAIRGASFLARMDNKGYLISFDAAGEPFDSTKQEWAQEEHEVSAEERQHAMRINSLGVFSALADSVAYLPPPGQELRTGSRWLVERQAVYPCDPYPFYMLTDGGSYSTERSTCHLGGIERTEAGRVATISIVGQRIPQLFGRGASSRVSRIDITGQLRVNLDTREIVELRIDGRPQFLRAEDRAMLGSGLVLASSVQVERLD